MTEGRPTTQTRRPDTARPRRKEDDEPAPPTKTELEAIERGLAGLSELAGASAAQDDSLGALIVHWPGHGPGFNYGIRIRWPDDAWRDAAGRLAARFRMAGEYPSAIVAEGHSRPSDLAARLGSIGWHQAASEVVCWTRRAGPVPHLDPSLRIEALTSSGMSEYEHVEREIFGLDQLGTSERTTALLRALESGRLRGYLVRVRGEPVAVTRLVLVEGLACLSGVGVRSQHRGQGLGRLITTIATRAGLATGQPLVWLSVDPENEPAWRLYAGLDYRPAFRWRRLVGPPRG